MALIAVFQCAHEYNGKSLRACCRYKMLAHFVQMMKNYWNLSNLFGGETMTNSRYMLRMYSILEIRQLNRAISS